MKIACSCAGEGFGHAARMVVLQGLLEPVHRVEWFIPREVQGFLQGKIPGFRCRTIPAFTFTKKDDRVLLVPTVLGNLGRILAFPFRVMALAQVLRREGIQAVIADFEPHLPRAARLAGIPVLQINHPGIVTRYPAPGPAEAATCLGARLLEGPWDRRIHISFYGGDMAPLLRKSLFRHPLAHNGTVVFNLKESLRPEALRVLAEKPRLKAELYPRPGGNFDLALAQCSAVVSTAGHQIIAECLALGKPLLVLPQKGQWEQELNARMLETLGLGMRGSLATLSADLDRFEARLPEFREAMMRTWPPGFRKGDGTADLARALGDFLEEGPSARLASPETGDAPRQRAD